MCDQADSIGVAGGKFGRVDLPDADHTPFWTETEALANAVKKIAAEV
jgi:hypothetical protein